MNKRAARALGFFALFLMLVFTAYAVFQVTTGADPWSIALTAVLVLAYVGSFLSLRRNQLLPPQQ